MLDAYRQERFLPLLKLFSKSVQPLDIEKLFSRLERGQIHGEGDKR